MNNEEGQPKTLDSLKKEKRELQRKIRQLELEDQFLEEKLFEVLSEIQSILEDYEIDEPK